MVYSKTKFTSVYEYTVGPIISVYNNLTISETKRLQQIQPLFLAHTKHAASHRIVYDKFSGREPCSKRGRSRRIYTTHLRRRVVRHRVTYTSLLAVHCRYFLKSKKPRGEEIYSRRRWLMYYRSSTTWVGYIRGRIGSVAWERHLKVSHDRWGAYDVFGHRNYVHILSSIHTRCPVHRQWPQ